MKSLVIPLDKGKQSGQPFFMISGLGGHVITFQIIAKNLSADWNAHGLMYPGFQEDEPTCNTVSCIAARMLPDVLATQANGPFYLVGYSMGGVVCLEMAKQLEAMGHKASVILIDVKNYSLAKYKPLLTRVPKHIYHKLKEQVYLRLKKNNPYTQKIREGLMFQGEMPKNLNESLTRVITESREAMNNYHLEPCNIPTILLRCQDMIWYDEIRIWPESYGWGDYTKLKAEITSPGDHMTIIKYPNVPSFTKNLEAALTIFSESSD